VLEQAVLIVQILGLSQQAGEAPNLVMDVVLIFLSAMVGSCRHQRI
jgi:hypothetical protein